MGRHGDLELAGHHRDGDRRTRCCDRCVGEAASGEGSEESSAE